MSNVAIVGIGMHEFGRTEGVSGMDQGVVAVRRALADDDAYQEVRSDLVRLQRLRLEVRFYRNLKSLLAGWRLFHAGLAVFLVIIIAGHIGLSLYLGFGWILF